MSSAISAQLPRRTSVCLAILITATALGLSACDDDDNVDIGNAQSTHATLFRVTVTDTSQPGLLNTQRAKGTVPLSPGAYAIYHGRDPAFMAGDPADAGTERIAEDGFPAAPLGRKVNSLGNTDNVSASGLFAQPGGQLAALEAGESTSFRVIASPGDKLALETMFVQSNDWFYGLDGLKLFNDDDSPISGDVEGNIQLYDAGTETDTPPGTGPDQKPAQKPTAINVGADEDVAINTAIQRHPGFDIPDTANVLRINVKPIKAVQATTFDVTITDDSQPGTINSDRAGGAVPLSPGAYAVYTGDNDPLFTPGAQANAGTERIAEDGFPSAPLGSLAGHAANADSVLGVGVFSQPEGKVAALEPGESTTFSVTAAPGDKLSLETMFVQSNDWFYGLHGLTLFKEDGTPISGNITDALTLYDAGTEADTPPGTGPDQKPAQNPLATDQGPSEDQPIAIASTRHPSYEIPLNEQVIHITIKPRS